MRVCQAAGLRGVGLSAGWRGLAGRDANADSSDQETMKRADAAFHEGFAAQQSGNLAVAREKFSVVVSSWSHRLLRRMKLWARCCWN